MKKGQIGITSDMVGAGMTVVGLGAMASSVAGDAAFGGPLPLDPTSRGLIGLGMTGMGVGILAIKDLLK